MYFFVDSQIYKLALMINLPNIIMSELRKVQEERVTPSFLYDHK